MITKILYETIKPMREQTRKTHIKDISYNKLIPVEHQLNPKTLKEACEEFGEQSQIGSYVVGYNPKHPECMSCLVQGYCMRLGRELTHTDRVKHIKDTLGTPNFYSDHKIYQLSDEYYTKFKLDIKNSVAGVSKSELFGNIQKVFKDVLNTSTEVFAKDMLFRIENDVDIILTEQEVFVWKD